MINLIGYIALSLNLVSMGMKEILYLRFCSLIANSIYIVYGALLHATPMIIGGSIAVIIQAYRISHVLKNNQKLNDTHASTEAT